MPYCFDVRFRTARPVAVDTLEREIKAATFKQPLRLYRPDGMNVHENWLAVRSCGYANHQEAEASGERLQQRLLVVAAEQKVGVEFYLRGAAKAIHVYPDGDFELRDPGLRLPTPLKDDDLKKMMDAAVASVTSLTPSQRVAAELLNDSFFNMSPEASFLLRVSAIEALCPQPAQTDAFRTTVNGLIDSIPKETLKSDRDQIEHALNMLAARQSVRSACRSKIKQLIGDDKAKQFDTIYDQRSKFLHDGAGRGTLDGPAAEALEIGLSLLLADIKQ
jgi:hypothetical protein